MSSKKKQMVAGNGNVAYVLLQVGWEYNDEVYFRPDSGGGNPVKVFTKKEDAEQEWFEKNQAAFEQMFTGNSYDGIRNYTYDIMDIINTGAHVEKTFDDIFGYSVETWTDKDCPAPPKKLTNKQWKDFMKCFQLEFFEIVQVEFGEAIPRDPKEEIAEIEHLKKVLELE